MKRKRVQVVKYLDAKLVEDLHKAVGVQMPDENRGGGMGDDIDEDIQEDFWKPRFVFSIYESIVVAWFIILLMHGTYY